MLNFSVAPVVRIAISPKYTKDLPKLLEGLKKLSKSDPLVVISQDPYTKEQIIAGCGDLHIQICIEYL